MSKIKGKINGVSGGVVLNPNKGYFATELALTTAFPTATDGDYAIVGATDTIWVWDSDTSTWIDSGGAAPAPSGGGAIELQDYQGQNSIGILGTFNATTSGTLTEVTFISDSIPVGANATIELRKNSTTSGSVLSSALSIATSDSLTNGKKQVSTTSFTSGTITDGDYFVAYLTAVGTTTPIINGKLVIRYS